MSKRRALPTAIAVLLTLALSTVAYAYGIQRHTVNAYDHGCGLVFSDPGCDDGSDPGDYYRRGQTEKSSGSPAYYINTEIWNAQTNSFKTRRDCLNCYSAFAGWDTNPTMECRFKTWHVALNVAGGGITLNGHWHYTEGATNTTGGC